MSPTTREAMGVPVILVVEDNIRYYSSFLPVIYTELITQSRGLFSEGLNVAHKLVRMRARPKILLCSNYEEAAEQAIKYRDYLFGVVSDVEFPRGGELTPDAGFELANMVREPDAGCSDRAPLQPDQVHERARMPRAIRFCANVRPPAGRLAAAAHRAICLWRLCLSHCRTAPKWHVQSDLTSLEKALHQVPAESLAYHASATTFPGG